MSDDIDSGTPDASGDSAGDSTSGGFLRSVYDLSTQEQTDDYYTRWAASYDEELTRQGYRTPSRCAAALHQFLPADAAILDIGCGTGMSGVAFAEVGFTDLTGTDVNPDMLAVATGRGVYKRTWLTDIADPFPFAPGTYAAIAAVGVIGTGAAPASTLTDAFAALAPDGLIVLSLNDLALATPAYQQALADVVESDDAEQLFRENGVHIEGLGSSATVFVIRRR